MIVQSANRQFATKIIRTPIRILTDDGKDYAETMGYNRRIIPSNETHNDDEILDQSVLRHEKSGDNRNRVNKSARASGSDRALNVRFGKMRQYIKHKIENTDNNYDFM